jgi:hypothetical protein
LDGGVTGSIVPIVKGGTSNVKVEFHDAPNEISQVEACLQHAQEPVMQAKNLATKEKEYFGLMSKYEIVNSKIKLKT